ncbi:hypothetical protein HSX37_10565|uniref:Uncharacterized protein n=1 Tax=Dendrosporobacter quercicolus TaxID=146817 RepID=A0A1G9R5F9_9FIRM|nr:hypothetical protein [Dendrosporobacter quercicolus]NSL48474.1 hypothetical protein [Dendrosporobacter quercicolus DSM 1736]SDM18067.1 hypothetical protein SAMN04488502_102416 [Dendrosporobacter quercicolus]
MADFKQRMSRHLRSARQWLTRAEESFDKESNIRAELDLMLAQAELQHAQEAKRAGEWRYKYLMMRHGIALGLAMLVAAGGLGGTFYLLQGRQASPPMADGQAAPPAVTAEVRRASDKAATPPAQEPLEPAPAVISPAPATTQVQPTSIKTTDRQGPKQEQRKTVDKVDHSLELPPDEMQKLMRAAGKSLRGQ